MSHDISGTLKPEVSTDERMDVDTSFLDAYRRSGNNGHKRSQDHQAERDAVAAEPQPDAGGTGEGPDEVEQEPEVEPDEDLRPDSSGQHGGGGTGGAISAPADESIPGSASQEVDADVTEAALDEDTATVPIPPHAASDEITPGSLQLTDHQEAVQSSAASRGGSGGSSEGGTALPQSGLRLVGVKSQPHIKSLPESVISALREQQRSAAVRELGVSDQDAREFSERLSQGALVTAFLLAQLDLGIDADPATKRAAELFQSRDPLLGSMAERMDSLERLGADQGEQLGALRQELGEVRQTATVVEQAISYAIADRSENFLRGSHNIHDAPIGHKTAIFVRDRAREATQKQSRLEREREGRPIR